MHALRAWFPVLFPLVLAAPFCPAQPALSPHVGETFWEVEEHQAIVWRLGNENRLPHADHLEMSGRRVSAIIDYTVDADRRLTVQREVIYPQLRIHPQTDSPDWFRYRAYLRAHYRDEDLPVLQVDEKRYRPGPLQEVRIDGALRFVHAAVDGVQVERTLVPSMHERLLVEHWVVRNTGPTPRRIEVLPVTQERWMEGPEGTYRLRVSTVAEERPISLAPGASLAHSIFFAANAGDEPPVVTPPEAVLAERARYVGAMREQLVLRTPDPVIDTLFFFSKIRAAESIFDSQLGLIHSPGGGNYYVGVWANDQAEYSGPFFPYLGYPAGNESALNAYLTFLDHLPQGEEKIFASFEMEGTLPCCSKDRGDAAMLAYGASHYALASGDPQVGRQLWPLITWGLDYSHRQLNAEGVVRSTSDEMEGRLPTGTANLATSSLYYAALQKAAALASALGQEASVARDFQQRAARLAGAIERYFGAEIAGLRTYRYFEGHQSLRHWISLPLVFGLTERADGTLTALFDRMWTPNGVRVELNPGGASPDLYWDRGTLYGLRGAFVAGATELAIGKLREYSRTRLLGFHVPYAIEAWPENNMRHLSAESALYCRIITEGLLGITPESFERFSIRPRLPSAWRADGYELRNLRLQGRELDISVRGVGADRLAVKVIDRAAGRAVYEGVLRHDETAQVRLDP